MRKLLLIILSLVILDVLLSSIIVLTRFQRNVFQSRYSSEVIQRKSLESELEKMKHIEGDYEEAKRKLDTFYLGQLSKSIALDEHIRFKYPETCNLNAKISTNTDRQKYVFPCIDLVKKPREYAEVNEEYLQFEIVVSQTSSFSGELEDELVALIEKELNVLSLEDKTLVKNEKNEWAQLLSLSHDQRNAYAKVKSIIPAKSMLSEIEYITYYYYLTEPERKVIILKLPAYLFNTIIEQRVFELMEYELFSAINE